jgi:hypothetical protein
VAKKDQPPSNVTPLHPKLKDPKAAERQRRRRERRKDGYIAPTPVTPVTSHGVTPVSRCHAFDRDESRSHGDPPACGGEVASH